MPFAYIKDPAFLTCFSLYWVNWSLEQYDLSTPLLQSYLNDIICIPFWVPMMLWVQRMLGLREHDAPPGSLEIAIPLVMWAVMFEVVIPAKPGWGVPAVADPYDVFCYCAGSLLAAGFWKWRYARNSSRGAVPGTRDVPKGLD